jgi:aryl-alcohol dehydrogenase-like predicted oxidoreductase
VDRMNRRVFVGTVLGAAGALGAGAVFSSGSGAPSAPGAGGVVPEPLRLVADATIRSPTDRVKLGRSGLSVSVVGVGTGSVGWGGNSNQTRLGQDAFTRMMRHALDRGVTLFDLADSYGSNPYFGRAMKGVPRDRYVIQTKTPSRDPAEVRRLVDRYLAELGTDHVDSLLIHCVTEGDWTTRYRGVMDVLEEARVAGKIRAHGVTCHSARALEAALASDWVQIHQVRWNGKGSHMDGDVDTMRALFARMRAKGQGMIGMKVVGQGDLVGRRGLSPDECFRFQLESGVVDAFVLGVESVEQIDRLIGGTQLALDAVGYRRIADAIPA